MGGGACLDRKNDRKMFQDLLPLTPRDAKRASSAVLARGFLQPRPAKPRVEIEASQGTQESGLCLGILASGEVNQRERVRNARRQQGVLDYFALR